jgi:hypothetical protein
MLSKCPALSKSSGVYEEGAENVEERERKKEENEGT